jgi:hypothetical protein
MLRYMLTINQLGHLRSRAASYATLWASISSWDLTPSVVGSSSSDMCVKSTGGNWDWMSNATRRDRRDVALCLHTALGKQGSDIIGLGARSTFIFFQSTDDIIIANGNNVSSDTAISKNIVSLGIS